MLKLPYINLLYRMLAKYFDYMATTPVHPDVLEEMSRYLSSDQLFANPDSQHLYGRSACHQLSTFSKRFCSLLGSPNARVVWTSGASESINLALKGAATQYRHAGRHIISWNTEHSATLESLRSLEAQGYSVTLLPVRSNGLIDLDAFTAAIRQDTTLVSICHVHNELGCIQPIDMIADLCAERGVLLHVDCAQSIGKAPLHLHPGIHFASFSAHKCYGPKGIGALVMTDPNRKISKLIDGGKQQYNLRSGTVPLYLIAGFVCAVEMAIKRYDERQASMRSLFQLFIDKLDARISWNGCVQMRTPYNINICMPKNIHMNQLDELKQAYCLSSHAACNPHMTSHVLDAIQRSPSEQARCLRISLGLHSDQTTVLDLIAQINALVHVNA